MARTFAPLPLRVVVHYLRSAGDGTLARTKAGNSRPARLTYVEYSVLPGAPPWRSIAWDRLVTG